jgi:hypothetical protein
MLFSLVLGSLEDPVIMPNVRRKWVFKINEEVEMTQKTAKKSIENEPMEQATSKQTGQAGVDNYAQQEQIALMAYFLAEARGFTPGNEMDDWLQAEQEVCSAPAAEK